MNIGHEIYFVGYNDTSAEYSGLKVKKIRFFAFFYCSLLATIAGILLTSRTFAVIMGMGTSTEMDAIAAVVLGGTSMSGGRAILMEPVIDAIIIGVLNSGMNLLGINTSW